MSSLASVSKRERAVVIRAHMAAAGIADAVCFSCGNAARALRDAGVPVLEIGPAGPLRPSAWWSEAMVRRVWPDRFDATSGHLSVALMTTIGARLRAALGELEDQTVVPCGSGETLVCLALAYPQVRFVAEYDMCRPETEYHPQAPLNVLVARLASRVVVKESA